MQASVAALHLKNFVACFVLTGLFVPPLLQVTRKTMRFVKTCFRLCMILLRNGIVILEGRGVRTVWRG